MDEADLAQVMNDRFLKVSLAAARRGIPNGKGPEYCADCGAVIPLLRREALPGCRFCVDCQREREGL